MRKQLFVALAYIPPLRFRVLTGAYDRVIALTMRETVIRTELLREAAIAATSRVLDFGCGTATLTIMASMGSPGAQVVGFDVDAGAVAIARAKIKAQGVPVVVDHGVPGRPLPYVTGSFDLVLCSLVLHHLLREEKLAALREIRRVLGSGGTLHVADFGRPQNPVMRAAITIVRPFDGWKRTSDNVAGRLPQIMTDAGFVDVAITAQYATFFGTVALIRARRP